FTLEEYYELMERFGGRCALTGSEDVHLDHFIPVHTGLGVTAVRNLIPLDARLNTSKGGQNPFEWINGQDSDIQTKFSEIVNYLAKLNGFTRDEYEAHVYNCFDN